MYLMNSSKPDIAYALNRMSRYIHYPNKDYWTTSCIVMDYIRGTIDLNICYGGYLDVLEGDSDAN